jgi:hypothetical protein
MANGRQAEQLQRIGFFNQAYTTNFGKKRKHSTKVILGENLPMLNAVDDNYLNVP